MLTAQTNTASKKIPLGFGLAPEPPSNIAFDADMTEDCLLCFDGGEQVSFADGTHNSIVLGTTGSGKSTQVILPALNSLIKAGFGGLVLDVKGNVTDQVRMLANEHGRLGDVVEFGPGPSATKVNLFAGIGPDRREALFRDLFCLAEAMGDNTIFKEDGLIKGLDVLDLQLTICRKTGIKFDFEVYRRLINDAGFAENVYDAYKTKLHNPENAWERTLVQRIEGDTLHYIQPKDKTNTHKKAWLEQTSYRMCYVRGAVENFYRSPGLAENFLAGVDENLDLARRVYDERKIVVLRLAVESGIAGMKLASHILHSYYQAVYRNWKKLAADQYTFCIADEFQDFYDSDRNNPLNDNAFVAKCREFRCISIYGTQSVAAMQSQAQRQIDAETFVANNNMRLFLYSDDQHTQKLAPSDTTPLVRLAPGIGVLAKYNVKTREHLIGEVSMQRMHDHVQEIFQRQAAQIGTSEPVMPFVESTEEKELARAVEIQNACDRLLNYEATSLPELSGKGALKKLQEIIHLLDDLADDQILASIQEDMKSTISAAQAPLKKLDWQLRSNIWQMKKAKR